MKNKILTFDGMTVSIPESFLEEEIINVDFNGDMMVQFEKQSDGTFKPRNAMNGHGQNCYDQIKNKVLLIEDEIIKLTCNFGGELDHCTNLPKEVVVYQDNDYNKPIGKAVVNKDGTADIIFTDTHRSELDKMANIFHFGVSDPRGRIVGDKFKDVIEVGVAGTAKREGNIITEFNLQSVSITSKAKGSVMHFSKGSLGV